MQIKYEYVSRKRTGVDSTIQARLAFTERSIAQHRAQLGKMVPILVLQEELKVVQDLSAKIAYILAASCDNVVSDSHLFLIDFFNHSSLLSEFWKVSRASSQFDDRRGAEKASPCHWIPGHYVQVSLEDETGA